ncbi:flagellar biosynthetic protein FliO [Clostridium sp. D2Q-11]|uniref:Flagellar protein n=1 Tax=Anaeromonas frigoriresistens TaxID=2683708 RepID=A0A942ZA07_9FIRM|nr:flagellar biosynthetic protein FliO [Anaeromonas frigoriresistens]MBS4539858.1 flagellar biosynthetic protein FliO [Anaeromonas frigoriresistens]
MLINYVVLANDSNIPGDIFKTLFAIFSFFIILILAYYTSKFIASNGRKLNNGRNMEIIDILNLGNNKRIMMVKIIDKIYILGSNNSGFNMIDTIEDETTIKKIIDPQEDKPGFENFLKDKLTSFNKNKQSEYKDNLNDLDYNKIDSLKKRIEYLKENHVFARKKDETK